MTGQPGPLRDYVQTDIEATQNVSAAILARREENREPTVDEVIGSLIEICDAHTRAICRIADVVDELVIAHNARVAHSDGPPQG